MAKYLFLLYVVYVNVIYYQAFSVSSTADVGGTLPVGFVPPAATDPLDASALTAFYYAVVQLPVSVRQRCSCIYVAPASRIGSLRSVRTPIAYTF